jgi:hypothetical protein
MRPVSKSLSQTVVHKTIGMITSLLKMEMILSINVENVKKESILTRLILVLDVIQLTLIACDVKMDLNARNALMNSIFLPGKWSVFQRYKNALVQKKMTSQMDLKNQMMMTSTTAKHATTDSTGTQPLLTASHAAWMSGANSVNLQEYVPNAW